MKTVPALRSFLTRCCAGLGCAAVLVASTVPAAETIHSAAEDFSSVAAAVVRLLESGDAAGFARTMVPTMDDWRATLSTNRAGAATQPLDAAWQRTLDRQHAEVEASAKALLETTAGLKVDFARSVLTANVLPLQSPGSVRYAIQAEGEGVPYARDLTVVIASEPRDDAPESERLRGEFRLSLSGVIKLAPGWRCSESVRWVSFPDAVGGEEVQRELAMLAKAAKYEGITLADDPALGELGAVLQRFLQSRDLAVYEDQALISLDAILAMIQKQAAQGGRTPPAQTEIEEYWSLQKQTLLTSAQQVIDQMNEAGIDLSTATIQLKDAEFQRLYPRAGAGEIDGLEGNQLSMSFTVQSDAKSKTGRELSGEYVVAAKEAMRLGGRWLINGELRMLRVPPGVVDESLDAKLKFENYVAEHDALPPGAGAPDIEFVRIDNEQKGKLSDLRGKVVILDIWSTWCGPCQEPMAKLQRLQAENPGWKERVAVVSLSIDDTLRTVRDHLDNRGWTNTFNTWAGEGGWHSAPAKAFRVSGVPTCYVIDADGKVVQGSHFLDAPRIVNELLK